MVWISKSFQVSEHIHALGGRHTPTPWGPKHLLQRLSPPRLNPMDLFIWPFICTFFIAFGPPVSIRIFPKFCDPLQQINQTQGGGQVTTWICYWYLKQGGSSHVQALNLWVLILSRVDCVRIEINCRTPNWGCR